MEGKPALEEQFNIKDSLTDKKKFPYFVTKDGVKWLLTVAKVTMDCLCVWPDRQNKATNFVNFFCITSFGCMIIAQLAFILDQETDIGSAADAITATMSSAEAAGRRLLGVLLAKKISKVLETIYYDFWPSNIAGKKLHKDLSIGSRILVTAMILESLTAFTWAFQCGLFPLSNHRLPLNAKYWFPYMKSPIYELLYIWESFMCIDMASNISTFDFFLLTLIWHCVAQFRLLRRFLEINFDEAVRKDRLRKKSDAMDLILIVIRRHNNLINTCKEIESMLTVYILILYIGTVGTVCLSSFLLIVVQSQVGKAVPYFFGHMLQIFLYCFVGNELILESTALSNTVAQCGWHLQSYERNLEKSLILIMVRSQRPITITVGGFGVLSLASYMTLLQFCFSVYTLLRSTVSMNQQN